LAKLIKGWTGKDVSTPTFINIRLNDGVVVLFRKLIQSVVVYKISEGEYGINFTKVGSFEDFAFQNKVSKQDLEEDAE